MMVWFPWLSLILFFLPSPSHSSSFPPSPFTSPAPLCHPHESSALFHFKNSFSIINDTISFFSFCAFNGIKNPNNTVSWDKRTNCCTWSGVTCDEVTGHVIRLDLRCAGLQGLIRSYDSLFLLTHLQSLDLSCNHFDGFELLPQFERFVSMTYLDLSYTFFEGQVPLEFSHMSSLVTLDLSLNERLRPDTFTVKRIVANLTSLRELHLSGFDMSYVSPHSFMNLSTSLTYLDLSGSGLAGKFPENIFHLPKLQNLDLSDNINLTGSFPQHNWSSRLTSLGLSKTSFLIDLPYLTKTLTSLNSLFLRSCNFRGSYPALLGNLTRITFLDLSSNNFGGQIPWSSLNLERLTYLRLRDNNFIGQLPKICMSTKSITFLCDSSKRQLIGPFPSNLMFLSLSNNVLNGTIPSWLYSLPNLQKLSLSGNQFTGHLEEFKSTSLFDLQLAYNNLQGLIPRSIFQQVNLVHLNLSSNNFSGISDLPYSLRILENLQHFDLSNNRIEGSLPLWFWNIGKSSLLSLDISNNLLTHVGQLSWKRIEFIDFSFNRLQGHLPIPPPSALVFSISNNQVIGGISSWFCNQLGWFEVVDLSNNNLTGKIPPCYENLSHKLQIVGIALRILDLHGNMLEGSLPNFLCNCEKLEILDIGSNKLNGSFPYCLESLPNLEVLILGSNRFHGPMSNPTVKFPFQKLIVIDLSNNKFTGPLPEKYFENFLAMMNAHTDVLEYMGSKWYAQYFFSTTMTIKGNSIWVQKVQKMFMTIDFSSNNFVGEIPRVIERLNSLKGLNFSHNMLSGMIPSSLGNLSNLEWLDLSSNKLFGNIPSYLPAELSQLECLNLSNNKLEGPIPRGRQFETFKSDSYGGNPGLCGFPLPKPCSNGKAPQDQDDDNAEHDIKTIEWKGVLMGYASGLVIGISVGYMVLFSRSFDYWYLRRLGRGRRRKISTRARRRRRSN